MTWQVPWQPCFMFLGSPKPIAAAYVRRIWRVKVTWSGLVKDFTIDQFANSYVSCVRQLRENAAYFTRFNRRFTYANYAHLTLLFEAFSRWCSLIRWCSVYHCLTFFLFLYFDAYFCLNNTLFLYLYSYFCIYFVVEQPNVT